MTKMRNESTRTEADYPGSEDILASGLGGINTTRGLANLTVSRRHHGAQHVAITQVQVPVVGARQSNPKNGSSKFDGKHLRPDAGAGFEPKTSTAPRSWQMA